MPSIDWDFIVRRIRDNRCVPFLGAGASVGFDGRGLPTGSQLAESLAGECDFPGLDPTDLFRVSQYYTARWDSFELQNSVRTKLSIEGVRPGFVHRTLASVPFSYVLTTNFDDLMEQAFRETNKEPMAATYVRRGDAIDLQAGTPSKPLVYKLHGSLAEFDKGLVLSEDDVIEFLSCLLLNEPPLPKKIKELFEQNSILFIGYGLRDWNIRVMLRAIRGGRLGRPPGIQSFAVQKRPEDPRLAEEWDNTVMYWDKRESLKCFDIDAVDFVKNLKDAWDKASNKVKAT
jgi:SIR2-like protein